MSNTMDNLRTLYTGLTEGEKIYLANKLWKDDKIVAQKIEEFIPEDMFYPHLAFNVGEEVLIKAVISNLDPQDSRLPYEVMSGEEIYWISADNVVSKA